MTLKGTIGHIQPAEGEVDRIDAALRLIVSDPQKVLVPVEQSYPSACIDGRPMIVSQTSASGDTVTSRAALRPRLAGGTLSTWIVDLLLTRVFRPSSLASAQDLTRIPVQRVSHDFEQWSPSWLSMLCSSLREAGHDVSCHSADASAGDDSGCGALDSLASIIAIIGQVPDAVAELMAAWGIPLTDVPEQVFAACSSVSLTLPTGADLAGIISAYASTPIPVAAGPHAEVAVIANRIPRTTVNPQALHEVLGGQAFVVDVWAADAIADFFLTAHRADLPQGMSTGDSHRATRKAIIATVCAFNAAAVLALSGPRMRVGTLSPQM
ncbi:hypothetical protein [Schaalia sp. ZJ1691]|uniref:hypothetical protein n=1 Tax=Schaalia sp. ZJ1691 TaxID=2709404 RepID=UPI0013EE1240|nr:hypothetical protein [Schaalia sp. ZJ1691]